MNEYYKHEIFLVLSRNYICPIQPCGAGLMRYRIAALIPDLINPYNRSTFSGIVSASERNDADLAAFICGGYKRIDYYHYMRNVLLDMIDPSKFDGFILPFSAISQSVPASEFKAYISPILAKPCVMVGAPLEGFTSVTPDYADVIGKISRHLFLHHKIEHLVLIGGPEPHITTILKEHALRIILSQLGIAEDRLTVLYSTFNPADSGPLVKKCEQMGFLKPGYALVFCGEEVALRAITEIQLLGYNVPDDVIVCGTSESINSRRANPSLTTVDNNFENIGNLAVEKLIGLLKGDTPGKETVTESSLVLRGSCGCISSDDEGAFSIERVVSLAAKIEKNEVPVDHNCGEANNLLRELLTTEKKDFFCSALDMSMRGHSRYLETFADSAFYDYLYHFRRIGNGLVPDMNFSELFGKGDERFSVKRCFISEYSGGTPDSGKLKLFRKFCNKGNVPCSEEGFEFAAADFYPQTCLPEDRSTMIVEPLFHEKEPLGILAIEYDKSDMLIHEALRIQISWAMKNIKQRQEILKTEQRFYDMAHISSDWLWEIDDKGILVFSSGCIASVSGFDSIELTGSAFFECIHSVDGGENGFLKKLFLEKRAPIHRIEVESRSAEGRRIVFELSGQPLFDSNGVFSGYRGGCKDITDTKMTEEKMSRLVAEKETLIRELYHRTKNNMQVISSMMGLQSISSGDTAMGKIFREMQNRILAMSLVHEKLYQSKDLSRINLREYIRDLALLLYDGYRHENRKIKIECADMQDVFSRIDTAIPCGMVLNELITNSLKYAFPDDRQGTIAINLSKSGEGIISVKVADDGVGVDPDFDFRKKAGMGMKVALALAENQMKAEVLIEKTNGVSFELRFKDADYSERI